MPNPPNTPRSPWQMIAYLKDPDQMFDLCMVGAFMAGQLNGMMPVEESRMAFGAIKKRLREITKRGKRS